MALTIARFVAAPIVAGLVFLASQLLYSEGRDWTVTVLTFALVVFILAALTDWLDGALARKLDSVSPLGAALDHAADKALTTATLFALGATFLPLDLTIAAALLVTRDVAVGGLREGLSLSGRALPVASLGKIKTVVTMTAIGAAITLQITRLVIADGAVVQVIEVVTRFTLWSAVILGLWSAVEYFIAAFKK
ncbi:MAG: CDP-alcohol phosphatidyltransferase family protein [Alphaproteobacteria bacterium]|nr:CDP-alcohol phosphatidyltransferase family protein [Alphaproteobacteria bacterium]